MDFFKDLSNKVCVWRKEKERSESRSYLDVKAEEFANSQAYTNMQASFEKSRVKSKREEYNDYNGRSEAVSKFIIIPSKRKEILSCIVNINHIVKVTQDGNGLGRMVLSCGTEIFDVDYVKLLRDLSSVMVEVEIKEKEVVK